MNIPSKKDCPICDCELDHWDRTGQGNLSYSCPRCGDFFLTPSAEAELPDQRRKFDDSAQVLSHALYRLAQNEQGIPILDTSLIKQIVNSRMVQSPIEQLDNLILWLGRSQSSLGDTIRITHRAIAAVGAKSSEDVGFLIGQAKRAQLVEGEILETFGLHSVLGEISLSLSGWQRFDELTRKSTKSKRAIIAMKFGDADFDEIVNKYFKQAVGDTGFELKRIDEQQPAGLIDDQMRVEIRQCRFLIADLSHHNNGAYWEAGFAEGLGKPVIYTCRKDVHDGDGTHFDTNHHLTVVWDPKNISEAMVKLKATIRATLPEEAKLSD